jgi:hypothetical protein
MWEPRRPTTLWASVDCYMDSFAFIETDTVDAEPKVGNTDGHREVARRTEVARRRTSCLFAADVRTPCDAV